ncbi:MAG TPA: hypothetical protein VFV03_01930, partial [Solirubrobacteraceae bacterium]|nr:hypothetical protein [Solirubrobacteraceae bacterium]
MPSLNDRTGIFRIDGALVSTRAYARPMQQSSALVLTRRPSVVVTGLGIEGWAPFAAAAAAATVGSALFIAWIANRWGGDSTTIAVDDVGEAVAALIAAGSCAYAGLRNTGRVRMAWALFGLSALTWAVGELIWSWNEVVLNEALPYPSIADAGFLLALPLAIVGVFAFTSAPTRLATRGETVLA